MRRKTLAVLLILTLVLVGCGNKKESTGESGTVTLDWFMWASNDAEVKSWREMADKVNEEYPEIHVNLTTAPWTEYWNKLQTQVAGGTAPDIISMQSMRLPGYGPALLPMDEFIEKDEDLNFSEFNEMIIENMKYDGKQAVLPYDFGAIIVYYNKDLFEKYNIETPEPGWTWAEFEKAAKALSKDGNYGFIANAYPDFWLPLALSNGGQYLKDGKYTINDPKIIETIEQISDMIKNKVSPPMVATNNGSWSMEQWLKGNVGMVLDGPWDTLWYNDAAKFEFGTATVPVGEKDSVSISAGSGFSISQGTKHPEEAYKAIVALTNMEAQRKLASTGRAYPARESARGEYYSQVPEEFKPVLQYADEHTVPYVITETWNQASDMITKALIPILNGEKTPQQGLDDLQKQLDGIQ